MTPTMISPYCYRVGEAISAMDSYFKQYAATHPDSKQDLRRMVQNYQREQGLDPDKPLQLKFLSQESFLFLIREVQYFLAEVNIDLQLETTSNEKEVFKQLHSTWKNKNDQPWDMLIWGNFDWYKHPWANFFVFKSFDSWSSMPFNNKLNSLTNRLTQISPDSADYIPLMTEFIRTAYEGNYMLFLPGPNNVYAVNKEVVFNPGRSAFVYLNDLEVTDLHWSLRNSGVYPKSRQRPLAINRQNFNRGQP